MIQLSINMPSIGSVICELGFFASRVAIKRRGFDGTKRDDLAHEHVRILVHGTAHVQPHRYDYIPMLRGH